MTMSDAIAAASTPPSPPASAIDRIHDADPPQDGAALITDDSTTEHQPDANPNEEPNALPLDVKALTDRALHFLATASNETLGACLAGLGAGTYLILGRVGLVLIGVVGGVVLHATWEGHHSDGRGAGGKNAEARKRELGADIAQRVLDWRNLHAPDTARQHGGDDLSVLLYSGKKLDYSGFRPDTAAALTELTDAVIRDYVKYVLHVVLRYSSNTLQVVVLTPTAHRGNLSRLVPPDLDRFRALHVCTRLPQTPSRQLY